MNLAKELSQAVTEFKTECLPYIKGTLKGTPTTIVLNDGKVDNVILTRQYGLFHAQELESQIRNQ